MIKTIIFDLDGVLIDCKDIHYEALNRALPKGARISRTDHISTFDGLNTRSKLEILTKQGRIREDQWNEIFYRKQEETIRMIDRFVPDMRIIGILRELKTRGYKLYVASNSIAKTIKRALFKKGFFPFITEYFSNENVRNPKPHSEIYLRCMLHAGSAPNETLILEDSPIGRMGAYDSMAHVCPIRDSADVTLEKIESYINKNSHNPKAKWQDDRLNILVPMAGAGSRFSQAGYDLPKPLIDVDGLPMIQRVVDNLNIEANYIFLVQLDHLRSHNLRLLFEKFTARYQMIVVDGLTEGAACTSLLAKHLIDNDDPLLIANSDQIVEWDSADFMYRMNDGADGGIVTFKATESKWSFAEISNGSIVRVAEKEPISDNATVGIYYWKKGSDYVRYAEEMIERDIRTRNEFYICPVYNQAIEAGLSIRPYQVERMHGIGTPEDLTKYLKLKNLNK